MRYLVVYDICGPKRLRRVAKACEDYGFRVQKSVFECDLPDDVFRRLWNRLTELIDTESDHIRAYSLCARCVDGMLAMGIAQEDQNDVQTWIF